MSEETTEQSKNTTEETKSEPKYRRYTVGRQTTTRDEMIKTSLYAALSLTTEQIAKMYFPSRAYMDNPNTDKPHYSKDAAKSRLYKLRREGILHVDFYTPIGESKQVAYWYLSQKQYKREAKAAERRNERYPEMPKRLSHYFKVTDIYAGIHPCFEELFSQLDLYDYAEWEWRNETHSFRQYNFQNKDKQHRPDAEVHMPNGQVFFIERQTKESRESKSVVQDKVVRANDYARYCGYSTEGAKLLFACDTERDKKYARETLQDSAIKGVLGEPDTIMKYLITRAEEIVENAEEAA